MKIKQPGITVLMPAYNAEKYIVEAIRSVLVQTFTAFELLIINDGSTDSTEQLVRAFDDDRVRLINQTNQGIAAALNMGLLNAAANLIARFDADDICMPQRLQLQYDFLQANPDHVIVGSDADYIDQDGSFVFTYRMPAHTNAAIHMLAPAVCPFIHSAVLFRKAAVVAAGGYNANAFAFQDHLLWLKIIQQGKAYNIPQPLLQVRLNPGSLSIDEKWRTKRYRKIKAGAIQRGGLTIAEGKELKAILQQQNNTKIKEGSYYSLLGKKYLWNNHQPVKARLNLKKAIRINPGRIDIYAILLLSFFPGKVIKWLYDQKTR